MPESKAAFHECNDIFPFLWFLLPRDVPPGVRCIIFLAARPGGFKACDILMARSVDVGKEIPEFHYRRVRAAWGNVFGSVRGSCCNHMGGKESGMGGSRSILE